MGLTVRAKLLRAMFAATIGAVATGLPELVACQPKSRSTPTLTSEFGLLDYEIVQTSPRKVILRQRMTIQLKDIQTTSSIASNGNLIVHKVIRLGSSFLFELPQLPPAAKQDEMGFGLTASRTDLKTVSWEWFRVDRPRHATKLQETGELGFRVAKINPDVENVRIDFLSNISIRLWHDTGTPFGFPDGKVPPVWRVEIHKGSYVRWPSLINGKIIPN